MLRHVRIQTSVSARAHTLEKSFLTRSKLEIFLELLLVALILIPIHKITVVTLWHEHSVNAKCVSLSYGRLEWNVRCVLKEVSKEMI